MPDSGPSILAKVPLLQGLKDNKAALDYLNGIMILKEYPANHMLIEEGALGDEFYVLIEGQVSVYKKTPDGDIYKVVILKSEMIPALGEGGLIEAEPRSATVKTDVPSKFLLLTRENFLKFCDVHPEWAIFILKRLALNLMGNLRKTSDDLMLLHKALMNEVRD